MQSEENKQLRKEAKEIDNENSGQGKEQLQKQLELLLERQKDVAESYDRVLETLLSENKLRQTLLEYQTESIRRSNVRLAVETGFMITAIIITVCHLFGYL